MVNRTTPTKPTADQIPQAVLGNVYLLKKGGFDAYLVGGCVRDLMLGRTPKDWDICTNAKPEQIQTLFPETFYENTFGTVTVKNKEEAVGSGSELVEVTPYRLEGEYSDGRRPDEVNFNATLKDDLARRDFTINSLAFDPIGDVLVDEYNGVGDMRDGIIRTVGEPSARFGEDKLRMIRAVRFAAQLDFDIEQKTLETIREKAGEVKGVSAERTRDEFSKLLLSDNIEYGMQALLSTGLLEYFIPELVTCVGVTQNQAHAFDVWTHLVKSAQHAATKNTSLELRLATLFHDIGKPATRAEGLGKNHVISFYGHDVVGAKMTKKILERLKYPEHIIKKVVTLIRWHMFFADTEQVTLSAVRRIVAQVGEENIWDLMTVRHCDRIGTGRPKENPYRLRKYQAMVEQVLRDPISLSQLAIDGNDLQKDAGIPAGPKIGWILHALFADVLVKPEENTKEILLARAQELNALPDKELRDLGEKGKLSKETLDEEAVKEILEKYGVGE